MRSTIGNAKSADEHRPTGSPSSLMPCGSPPCRFRVLSLNCLAPSLVDEKYKAHDPRALHHAGREANTLGYVLGAQADLVALQEVEPKQFERFRKALRLEAYDGIYEPHAGARSDGVCLFWNTLIFKLVEARGVNYKPDNRQDGRLRAQIAALEFLADPEEKIVVSNCHLIFNFSKSAYKMAQILTLISHLYRWKLKYSKRLQKTHHAIEGKTFDHICSTNDSKSPAVLMLGDFNLTPYSAMYSWLVTGVVNGDILGVAQGQIHPGLLSGQALMFNFPSDHGSDYVRPLFGSQSDKGRALAETIQHWPMHMVAADSGEMFARCRHDYDAVATSVTERPQGTTSLSPSHPLRRLIKRRRRRGGGGSTSQRDSSRRTMESQEQSTRLSPEGGQDDGEEAEDAGVAAEEISIESECGNRTALLCKWLHDVCPALGLEWFVDQTRSCVPSVDNGELITTSLNRQVAAPKQQRQSESAVSVSAASAAESTTAAAARPLPEQSITEGGIQMYSTRSLSGTDPSEYALACLPRNTERAGEGSVESVESGDSNESGSSDGLKRRRSTKRTVTIDVGEIDPSLPWSRAYRWLHSNKRLTLPFELESATAEMRKEAHTGKWIATEPFATVCQGRQRGTVDYIFIEAGRFEVIWRKKMLQSTEIKQMPDVPNMTWTVSDHFDICVELEVKKKPPPEGWLSIVRPSSSGHRTLRQ